ncbi:DUF1330 domain-containing protein [Streptomyces cellulosae]|uniref:DUF1330 domain-containing protein n=1 Tax=Streptomyces cellulosae TaxID=1968 RepID=A0ABW7YFP8_STRCE
MLIHRFPSVEDARAWYETPAYQAVFPQYGPVRTTGCSSSRESTTPRTTETGRPAATRTHHHIHRRRHPIPEPSPP